MIKRLQLFLGPEGARALFILLATTGLISLILNAIPPADWVRPVQSLMALIFMVGAAIIVWMRLDSFDRGRWLGLLAPAFGAVVLGVTVAPNFLLPLIGGAVGWVLAGVFIFNPRGPMQYQQAVKHLRKNEYDKAVEIMNHLIVQEPKEPNHFRFRAELLRLWGKLDRAKRDYKKMTELAPDSAVAFNGLAEVYLQAGEFENAHEAALKAYSLAPGEWVAAYNLGMIEDRLGASEAAVEHLTEALKAKVPDARHRLLIYFYLIRAYVRLNQLDAARNELKALKKQASGVNEWQTLFKSDQAATLRAVIEQDVNTAEALIDDEIALEAVK